MSEEDRQAVMETGWIDVHNHILPGIDDGSRSMEETLEMLRIASEEGITCMIVTPHYKAGRHNASPEKIERLIREVELLAAERGYAIELLPGNEIFYFSEMDEALEEGRLCTMNGTEYVLVEFLPGERYAYIRNALDNIIGMGYRPILAHIERCECFLKKPEYAKELRDMGVQLQVNASSVAGEAGFRLKHFSRRILQEGLVTYIGTDAHSCQKRTPTLAKCRRYMEKRLDEEDVRALLGGNAERYLLGQDR